MSDQRQPTGADSIFELGLAEENPKSYYPGHRSQAWLTVIAVVGLLAAIAIPQYRPSTESCSRPRPCIAHLKQIDSAKEQWAMDNKKIAGAEVHFSDLVGATLYMKSTPTCPSGGEYSVNIIGANPTCSCGKELL